MNTPKLTALFLAVFAITLHAQETVQQLKTIIETYEDGGLVATVDGNTITVTGTKTGAITSLALHPNTIDAEVNVIWKAELTGNTTSDLLFGSLVYISANVSFEMQSGKIEEMSSGTAIKNSSTGALTISGGTVQITGSGVAIGNFNPGAMTISGGTVQAGNGGAAIFNDGTVTISSGTVQTGNGGKAIYNGGTVTISGGTVQATGSEGTAVYNYSGTVNISGGTVQATGSEGTAVYNESTDGILLSGNPTITGTIMKAGTGILSVNSGFNPTVDKTYKLDFTNFEGVAVAGGAYKASFFTLANSTIHGIAVGLAAQNSDLVLAATNGYGYAVAKSGTTYTITKGTGTYAVIQQAIDYIRTDVAGNVVTIQFENGTNVLDVSTDYVTFDGSTSPAWGAITLAGKITASLRYNGSRNSCTIISHVASITSTADIANTGETAAVCNLGTMTISGGTVQSMGYYDAAIYNGGTMTISGGTVQSMDYYAAAVSNLGTMTISGGTVQSMSYFDVVIHNLGTMTISGGKVLTNTHAYSQEFTPCKSTICNSDNGPTVARLEITGGTVENTTENGNAVYNESTGDILLSGNPTINGTIMKAGTGILSVNSGFNPISGKTYKLGFTNFGGVAVAGGASKASFFSLANPTINGITMSLAAQGSDLVLAATNGYAVAKSGTTYTITKGAGTYAAIQQAIDYIRTEANSEAVTIQFGNGTNVLDISTDYVTFDGSATSPAWGAITLTGKITAATSSWLTGTINCNGASITSRADIANTGSYGTAVFNDHYDNLTGTVNISSGTISVTTGRAVVNHSSGTVNISGGTVTAIAGYAVENGPGTVNISSGMVQATGSEGTAVYNYSGTVNISGGTVTAIAGYAVENGPGTVNISGGTVSATTGAAVHNEGTGGILLSGNPTINGTIMKAGTGILSVNSGFNPTSGKTYKLGFTNFEGVAVAGGASKASFFSLANPTINGITMSLAAQGSDLVLATTNGYTVTNSGATYTITKGTGTYFSIQSAIDNIRTQANGTAVTIQFGNGTNVLDVSTDYITFDGSTSPAWGAITLAGKITAASPATSRNLDGTPTGTINCNGVSITSTADIANTGSERTAVNNGGFGELTISGGIILATGDLSTAVYNGGAVTISGGIVSATGEYPSTAVYNNPLGTVTISGGTVTATAGYAVDNYGSGTVTISGGIILATGFSAAVHNNSGTLNIIGGLFVVAYDTEVTSVIYGDYNAANGTPVIVAIPTGLTATAGQPLASVTLPAGWSWANTATVVVAGTHKYLANYNTFIGIEVSVEGKAGTPIIPQIAGGNIRIQTAGNVITLENLPSNAKVQIYNLQGKQTYSTYSGNSQILKILVQTKGMYIVRINTQTLRIAVK